MYVCIWWDVKHLWTFLAFLLLKDVVWKALNKVNKEPTYLSGIWRTTCACVSVWKDVGVMVEVTLPLYSPSKMRWMFAINSAVTV